MEAPKSIVGKSSQKRVVRPKAPKFLFERLLESMEFPPPAPPSPPHLYDRGPPPGIFYGKTFTEEKSTDKEVGKMGDYEHGKEIFMKRCAQCHVIDSIACKNGPTLNGIIGRRSGSVENYSHSESSTAMGVVWTHDTLVEYLKNPRKFIPGTKMNCTGLKKAQDREDLVTFVETESKKPAKDAGQKWEKPKGHPLPLSTYVGKK